MGRVNGRSQCIVREREGGYLRHSKFAEKAPMERKMTGKVIIRLRVTLADLFDASEELQS